MGCGPALTGGTGVAVAAGAGVVCAKEEAAGRRLAANDRTVAAQAARENLLMRDMFARVTASADRDKD